jgi:hypothetical protein
VDDSTSRDDAEHAAKRNQAPSSGSSRGSSSRDSNSRDNRSERHSSDRRPERTTGNTRGDAAPARKPWEKRDGAAPARKPWEKRDGAAPARKPWEKRDGGASGDRHGGAPSGPKKLWTRDGAPARGDRDAHRREVELTKEEQLARELKPVRSRHDDPEIPDDVTVEELDRVARNELKTLSKDNAEGVAKHLVMAARMIETDPALAHEHAVSAARRAGRIAMVRETLAITAYGIGDFALALRELRTYRRISGSNNQLPLMVDSERGVGRPDRALELGRSVDRSTLPNEVQASLAIAMSGARLDQGNPQAALAELEIPQLDPRRAYSYSPDLYAAYAEVLEELGRSDEAAQWRERADRADAAFAAAAGEDGDETIDVIEEETQNDDGTATQEDEHGDTAGER